LKVEGNFVFEAPRAHVYAVLRDSTVLQDCIPGCESLVLQEDGRYLAKMKVGISAIRGTFTGHVQITDEVEATSYRLLVDGSGGPGFVKGQGLVTLSDAENPSRRQWRSAGWGNDRGRRSASTCSRGAHAHDSVLRVHAEESSSHGTKRVVLNRTTKRNRSRPRGHSLPGGGDEDAGPDAVADEIQPALAAPPLRASRRNLGHEAEAALFLRLGAPPLV
jgi:carbon monoxide dehydrogenase subunit G